MFLDIERTPVVRIRGYVEEVAANLSDDRFKGNFRLSRGTFEWLMESLKNCPELIPQNIGKGGRAAVPLEKQLLTKSVTRAVQIVQLITQVAAFKSPRKPQRLLPMLFQPFQPGLMRVEKVEQPNQPKTVFFQ